MPDVNDTTQMANPFDNLCALRLDQSYADTVGVKKLLTTVPVRKPNRQDFVRVHPDPGYRLTPAAIIEVSSPRFGRSISSSAANRAKIPSRYVWLRGNYAAVGR